GAQLTPTELMQLVSSDTTTQTAGVNDGDRQRSMITTWLQLGVLGGDTNGITTYAELRTRMQAAIATISAPHMDAARATYELGLNGAPLLCLRAIPVAAPTTTDEVLAALQSGTSFIDAAKKFSSDPSLASTGGLIADSNGQACIAATSLNAGLIKMLEASKAVPGTPVAIAFNNQNIVVLLRPFDDLADNEKTAFAQKELSGDLKQRLATTNVYVSSRYGHWDPKSATVVPQANG
ncbi:MAG: hypothetical protein WCI22_17365, partial [Actinomycetota bacterium]